MRHQWWAATSVCGRKFAGQRPTFYHCAMQPTAVWPPGSADTVCPRPLLTLTHDRLTLKLACESYLRWGTFLPNLGTLGLWVLELFAMYATDGQTEK